MLYKNKAIFYFSGIRGIQMSSKKLPEIRTGRCERARVSDVETALELPQRPGLFIQLFAGQNL